MKHLRNKVEDVKIAYIGGGSRGWAWGLMSDLVTADDISGRVDLYDIDCDAAKKNEIIGNRYNDVENAKSHWEYRATETLEEALDGANFVVISILPGTFDEMESDVHAPEKYGIYQSVGDTVGPGGVIRALRLIPMVEVIAKAVKKCCPKAWVINYTNPMTMCVKALYRTFPEIKAFGCCHEVFGTQSLLTSALDDICGIEGVERKDISINVLGVNHFTWLTSAKYKDIDLFPVYREFAKKYAESGYWVRKDSNWMNDFFSFNHKVKFDLFNKYGYIAAAGDRHLAEFCDGKRYLRSPETAKEWGFNLTPVSWRKQDLQRRLKNSEEKVNGKNITIKVTGEEGVSQIRALLGLHTLVTNVNIPNLGQIPNLPIGAVVETNAVFKDDSLVPCFAGAIPSDIYDLINNVVSEQEEVVEAAISRDLERAFNAFVKDSLVTIGKDDARKLFDEMVDNTKAYLGEYFN